MLAYILVPIGLIGSFKFIQSLFKEGEKTKVENKCIQDHMQKISEYENAD